MDRRTLLKSLLFAPAIVKFPGLIPSLTPKTIGPARTTTSGSRWIRSACSRTQPIITRPTDTIWVDTHELVNGTATTFVSIGRERPYQYFRALERNEWLVIEAWDFKDNNVLRPGKVYVTTRPSWSEYRVLITGCTFEDCWG